MSAISGNGSRSCDRNPRLQDADIWLLGWSEGNDHRALAAEAYPDEISGLLLAGYCNDRMDVIFDWQQSGELSMIFYRQYFDTDGDGSISEAEYTADPYNIVTSVLADTPFADIDADSDDAITAADFAILLEPGKQAFYDAVARGDDAWLEGELQRPPDQRLVRAHQALQPNSEVLPTLDLPIHIFHGTADTNCSVEGIYAIRDQFAALGKTNLTTHVYEGYDHNLLYDLYVINGAVPPAFVDLFQSITYRINKAGRPSQLKAFPLCYQVPSLRRSVSSMVDTVSLRCKQLAKAHRLFFSGTAQAFQLRRNIRLLFFQLFCHVFPAAQTHQRPCLAVQPGRL